MTQGTLQRLTALTSTSPTSGAAQVIADFYAERGQPAKAQQALLLAEARSIEFAGLPDGAGFLDLPDPAGRHPAKALARGVLVRAARHLPELEQATPAVHGSTHVDRGGVLWLEVAGRGPFFPTVCFELSDLVVDPERPLDLTPDPEIATD